MFVFFAIFFPCATVWARRKADVTYGILVGAFDLESLPAGTEELLMCTSSDFVGLSSRPATLGPMVQRYVMHRDRRSVVPNQELSSPCKLTFFFFFSSLSSPKRLDSDRIQGDGQPELGTECVPVQRHDQAQEKTGFIRNESQAWTRFARRCRSPPFQARTDKRQGGYDSRQDRSRSSKLRSGGRRMV